MKITSRVLSSCFWRNNMKKLTLAILLTIILVSCGKSEEQLDVDNLGSSSSDCSSLASLADDAESYAGRAYNASDFDECTDYARQAQNAASDAASYANSCSVRQ